MEQRLSIITLVVEDLTRSRAFYRDVFGWSEIEPVVESIAFFQLPGIQFALYPQAEMAKEHTTSVGSPQGFTLAHNVNSEEEVDAVYADAVSKGATGLKAPEKVFWGGYSSYIAGPDGEQWEVAFNPYTLVNDDGTYGASTED